MGRDARLPFHDTALASIEPAYHHPGRPFDEGIDVRYTHGLRRQFPVDQQVGQTMDQRPGASRPLGGCDGWLMSVVLERDSGRSALAILDARRLADGPVATVRLRHHTPLSFHGFWQVA